MFRIVFLSVCLAIMLACLLNCGRRERLDDLVPQAAPVEQEALPRELSALGPDPTDFDWTRDDPDDLITWTENNPSATMAIAQSIGLSCQ